MNRRVLAFDLDGTLAECDVIPPALQTALERLRATGYVLFLVTGRRFESLTLGPLEDVFTGIVWENGAVLYHTATGETFLPFGEVEPRLVQELETAGVPLERGMAIVSTWTPHEETVWRVVNRWGGEVGIAHNKGAVMIMPAGTAKGSGLERMLHMCGFSPRNLVGFGDAENDISLLTLGEFGVAVADAVPALKEIADLVTKESGPAGVQGALEEYWLAGRRPDISLRRERMIPMGEGEVGAPVEIPGGTLAGGNLGVFGDSGSGKSWVTGLLAEGMNRAGYQMLLIDPEGDFRGMRVLPGIAAVDGDEKTLATPEIVTALLDTAGISVVLDLCSYPVERRMSYVTALLRAVEILKQRHFRPHWIVLEEAQYFLPPQGSSVLDALQPQLVNGGWGFVSYRPDWIAAPVMDALDHILLTRLTEPAGVQAIQSRRNLRTVMPAEIPRGYAELYGSHLVRLRVNARRVPHIRHLYKYLDTPLPKAKRFYFWDKHAALGLEAASLFEFLQLLPALPIESLSYHLARGDFAAWAEHALGDAELAAHLRKFEHRHLEGEAVREALLQRVTLHYAELRTL